MSPEILSHLFLLYIFEVWSHNSGVTQFDRTEKPGCAFVIHIVSAFSLEYASLVISSMMLGPATRAQLISISRRSLCANGGWTDISISMRGKVSRPRIPLMIVSLFCPARTCWHRRCLKKYERLQPQTWNGLFFTNFTNHMLQKYKYEISYNCGQIKFTS